MPFFQSTTTLLHLLLELGYDCAKPDVIIMKTANKLNIVERITGEKNLVKAIKFMQFYSLSRQLKTSIVDLYFLIDGGQTGSKKYVSDGFYLYN